MQIKPQELDPVMKREWIKLLLRTENPPKIRFYLNPSFGLYQTKDKEKCPKKRAD